MAKEKTTRPTNINAEIYKVAIDVAEGIHKGKKWTLERALQLYLDANSRGKSTSVRWTPRSDDTTRPTKVNKRLYDKAVDRARRHSILPQDMLEEGLAILVQVHSRKQRRRKAGS